MNIFFLSKSLKRCARYHFDKHVIKMILELTQLLSTAHWALATKAKAHTHLERLREKGRVYKATHTNHPSAKWTRAHINNYTYVAKLGLALCREYQLRYGEHKEHKCESMIVWLLDNAPRSICTDEVEETVSNPHNLTYPLPLAMPNEFKEDPNDFESCIQSYRTYYQSDMKSHLQAWKRGRPQWFD
jgi:hypothetical protein